LNYDAISPIDGRYASEAKPLARFFSERALASERARVELEYLALLIELGIAPKVPIPAIKFSMSRVKGLERDLGHDVKAVEVFLRDELIRKRASTLAPYVHMGLTSEDVTNVALSRLLSSAMKEVIIPSYEQLALKLCDIAEKEARSKMVARTHGQPAIPTTFGKEMAVFAVRIAERTSKLKQLRPLVKFSGAVGTYASFTFMARQDWPKIFSRFVSAMDLDYTSYSTQVVPGERLSDILHLVINVNQLTLSLARDLWLYQSYGLVRFPRPGKVSSSTMPQKLNPVDLENAEGQVEISNSLLILLAYKLQVTRMQRDLSDSVVRRMLGQALTHSLLASNRLLSSLSSMEVDRGRMRAEVSENKEIFGEAVQLTLRMRGDSRGYEKVKAAIDKGKFPSLASYRGKVGAYLGLAPLLAERCREEVSRLLHPQ
jgi:adenylosuccinate lyase